MACPENLYVVGRSDQYSWQKCERWSCELERKSSAERDIYGVVQTHLCLAAELPTSITGPNQITRVKTTALKRVLSLIHLVAHRCNAGVPELAMTKSRPMVVGGAR